MQYEFPIITHIDDVLWAIQDSPEFIVVQKDGYQVINYMVVAEDTFPTINTAGGSAKSRKERALKAALRRECRGIKFDLEGNLIARPYHKFFNVNERDETRFEKIDLAPKHVLLEKLDGSMVHPFYVNGHIRWATKMGITDTSMQVEEYVARNWKYFNLAEYLLGMGLTPIFEWCSNKNRIVLSYPEDMLYLTAIRRNLGGQYVTYNTLKETGALYDVPVVPVMSQSIDEISKMENVEGIVIRYDDQLGHMYKLKTEWYVLRHNSKDAIMREKNVLKYCVEDKIDDIIPYLTEEDAAQLRKFYYDVDAKIIGFANKLECEFIDMQASAKGNRRAFAELNTGPHKQFLFKMLDGHSIYESLKKSIAAKCNTQAGVDSIRDLIGGLKWNYGYANETTGE
jgi:RNA ligase